MIKLALGDGFLDFEHVALFYVSVRAFAHFLDEPLIVYKCTMAMHARSLQPQ